MKKTLVVAAIVAASIVPAVPAGAADMATSAKAMTVPAYCYFLPLLPKCIEAWKEEADAMKAKMDASMKK